MGRTPGKVLSHIVDVLFWCVVAKAWLVCTVVGARLIVDVEASVAGLGGAYLGGVVVSFCCLVWFGLVVAVSWLMCTWCGLRCRGRS